MELDTIHHQLLLAFSRSNHAMTSRIRAFGLMPGQPKVLEFVAENEGCLQRDIARACAMDRATTTGLLARMEETGLVERRPKAGDRRALEVWLTDAGWAAAEHAAVCGAEVDAIAAWLASLPGEVVYHVTRYFPRWRMMDVPATSVATVRRLADVARRHLAHVHVGNC